MTEIETWLRDPYSIYAKHILRLQPLDAIDEPPGARDRGTMIHGAIGAFRRDLQGQAAGRRDRQADRVRREIFRAAEGSSRSARVLVAAFPAHRAMVCRLRGRAPRQSCETRCRNFRQADDCGRRPHLHLARTRRPHRASARRTLCAARLQDRHAADGAAGQVRACRRSSRSKARSCARAALPAFPPAHRLRNSSMSRCAAASRREFESRSPGRTRRPMPRPTSRCGG